MLVRRARAGDREAFAALYQRHYDAVARVCRRRLDDRHLAEDATQETFLRAWKALPNFTHDVDLSHWLRRIARNHCHDLWRASNRQRTRTVAGDLLLDIEDPRAEHAVTAAADRLAVHSVLAGLRPRDAQLLVDHHAAGVSVRALAQRWQMTKGAMEVALHRARQRARRAAEQRGVRGVVPLVAARRAWDGVARAVGHVGEAAGPAATGLGNLAIMALLVIPPMVGAPTPDAAGRRPAQAPTVHGQATTVSATPVAAGAAAAGGTQPRRRAAVRPSRSGPEGRPAPVDVGDAERITVPGTNHTVSRSMTGRRVGTIGARDPVLGEGVMVDFDERDWEPLLEAYERACPVARSGEPVTYCDEG